MPRSRSVSSHLSANGGGCINDTIIHIASNRTPFGGVGMSGMGSYHGRRSFLTFSHEKTIVDKWSLFDLPVRYHPYTDGKKEITPASAVTVQELGPWTNLIISRALGCQEAGIP